MMEDTKAANLGSGQLLLSNSSGWINDKPWKACSRSTGPCICVPHAPHAWRWISAERSTTTSLSLFSITETFSLGATATTENAAPCGFQHLVHPQAWL